MQPTVEPAEDLAPFELGQGAAQLPDDRALPALQTIRTLGLTGAMPSLRLGDGPVGLRIRNYVPGSRATFEAHVGDRRFAVKLYAHDPAPEAEAYQRLAHEGLAQDSGARVPQLLAYERDLRILVLSWLEGPSASRLIREARRASRRARRFVAAGLLTPGSGSRTATRLGAHAVSRWRIGWSAERGGPRPRGHRQG